MSHQYIQAVSEVTMAVLAEKLHYLIEHKKHRVVSVVRGTEFRRIPTYKHYTEDMEVADYLIIAEEDDD